MLCVGTLQGLLDLANVVFDYFEALLQLTDSMQTLLRAAVRVGVGSSRVRVRRRRRSQRRASLSHAAFDTSS